MNIIYSDQLVLTLLYHIYYIYMKKSKQTDLNQSINVRQQDIVNAVDFVYYLMWMSGS